MRKSSVIILISTLFVFYFIYSNQEIVEESIIFFPIDSSVIIKEASTKFSLMDEKDNDEYIVNWEVTSSSSIPVYLRQDISLLFADGRLKAILSDWKDEKQGLSQYASIHGEDSSFFQSISFHHAEIHYDEDKITSAQSMSSDYLYVIDSSFSPLQAFKEPENNEQKEWQQVLNKVTEQQLMFSWNKAIDYFNIERNKYDAISLLQLQEYNKKAFPTFTYEKTQEIIGKLWEGLYKEYFLGVKTYNGQIVPPIGSSIPLLLFSTDKTHVFIVFETAEGTPVQLIQKISYD
ncbi:MULTISPECIES: hypothetical protein [Bacillus]|uniref:hypothetical protein n=1 Tax=Bacillus TaxID=1386 RepID=UPI000BB7CE41|nr:MULTISPECIES: hypothetical protein [Bacillus]